MFIMLCRILMSIPVKIWVFQDVRIFSLEEMYLLHQLHSGSRVLCNTTTIQTNFTMSYF